MAVAVQSVSSTAPAGKDSGEYISITKPSGVANGDLMIMHVVLADPVTGQSTTVDIQDSSGVSDPNWISLGSQIKNDSGNTSAMRIYYKIASSEGASYRVANNSGSGLLIGGAIFRIDGHGSASHIQIAFDVADTGDSTPVFTNTITPSFANSLILILASGVGNLASSSASSYAIANDNPTWTEQYDLYGTGDTYFGASDADTGMCGASAVRSQTTATGDSSLTWSGAHDWSIGALVVIPPSVSVTNSPAVIDLASSVQAPSVTGSANVSPTVVSSAFSVQTPTITTAVPEVSNIAKNNAVNIDNLNKS